MKNQALFSSKDKNKTLKCRLLQFCLALQGLTVSSSQTVELFSPYYAKHAVAAGEEGGWGRLSM